MKIIILLTVGLLVSSCASTNLKIYEQDRQCVCTQNQPNYNAKECEVWRLQEPEKYWEYIGSVCKNPGYFEVEKCNGSEWVVKLK
jgi:hypothetical protein